MITRTENVAKELRFALARLGTFAIRHKFLSIISMGFIAIASYFFWRAWSVNIFPDLPHQICLLDAQRDDRLKFFKSIIKNQPDAHSLPVTGERIYRYYNMLEPYYINSEDYVIGLHAIMQYIGARVIISAYPRETSRLLNDRAYIAIYLYNPYVLGVYNFDNYNLVHFYFDFDQSRPQNHAVLRAYFKTEGFILWPRIDFSMKKDLCCSASEPKEASCLKLITTDNLNEWAMRRRQGYATDVRDLR